MSKENELVGTKLVRKEYSPLIIRRVNRFRGIPTFVAIITDDNLDDLDKVVRDYFEKKDSEVGDVITIQEARNIAGELVEQLTNHYTKAEGVAVVMYFDKLMVSSLWGDFMNHTACRIELYSLLLMMTNI